MADSPFSRWRPDAFARKWHALAKRRRDHLIELYDTGRWRRYFAEEVFRAQLREAVKEVEQWGALAAPPAAQLPPPDEERAA